MSLVATHTFWIAKVVLKSSLPLLIVHLPATRGSSKSREETARITAMLTLTIKTPVITYTQPLGLFIDGQWVEGVRGKTFDTINPTTEQPIVAVHEAGPEG
jgi:hypothetical protein